MSLEKYPESCLYWIYLEDTHNDPFSQGYIGVSVQGADRRFKKHKTDAKNGSLLIVHCAIRKYGDIIKIKTLLKGSPEYCLLMEEKFREIPFKTGTWNMCKGGFSKQSGMSPSLDTRKKLSEANKGLIKSEETRDKLSKANIGKKLLETTKLKLSVINTGKVATQAKLDKMKSNMQIIGPWGHSYSKKDVWILAISAYDYLVENPKHGPVKLIRFLEKSQNSCTSLYKKLKANWNPNADAAYKEWLFKYTYQQEVFNGSPTL